MKAKVTMAMTVKSKQEVETVSQGVREGKMGAEHTIEFITHYIYLHLQSPSGSAGPSICIHM